MHMCLNAEKGPQRLLRTLRHPISHAPIHQAVLGSASNPIVYTRVQMGMPPSKDAGGGTTGFENMPVFRRIP